MLQRIIRVGRKDYYEKYVQGEQRQHCQILEANPQYHKQQEMQS